MGSIYDVNAQLDNDFTYYTNYPVLTQAPDITITGDVTTIINTINGKGGSNFTIDGGTTGLNFGDSATGISMGGTLNIANGGTGATTISMARANLQAAKLGVNDDITAFTALTGNTGVNPWTGTPNGASQSTYPATVASALYSQTEMQDLMDKMQDVTEFMMFLVAALLAPGIVET